jgi:hypothetical protein
MQPMSGLLKTLMSLAFVAVIDSAHAQQASIKLSYYGESITHYGLRGGYESVFRTKSTDRKMGTVTKNLLYSGNIALYRHPHNHIGIILSPELEWRRNARKGRFIEVALAPSLFRYFYEGKTFEINESGNLERVKLAGRTTFLPTLSFGFGRDMSVNRNMPISWYSRINAMRQFPYNASSLTRVSIELGIIRKLKSNK